MDGAAETWRSTVVSEAKRRVIGAALLCALLCGACGDDEAVPGMIDIPGGAAWIGCSAALEVECTPHEMPRHAVTVEAFAIDEHEVTVEDYVAFLEAHGNSCDGEPCADDYFDDSPVTSEGETWTAREGMGSRPMTKISWFGANTYCEALSKRLCSEAEWEVAALGTCDDGNCEASKTLYPWGDDAPTCALTHMFDDDDGCGTGSTAPVGGLPAGASPFGVLDMAGNAWEWVADSWHEDYTDAPSDGSAWTDPASGLRVVRGGGLGSGPERLRGSHRWNAGADNMVAGYGFRCCR
jgi:formylglycine-generating enzyme required for sulfatase activity